MLEGASNFRSLEGMPTSNGRRIRPHVLFRSDELSRLTPQDWNTLQQMNLRAVCDLRREDERLGYETRVPAPQSADIVLHSWDYDAAYTAQMMAMRDVIREAMAPLKEASDEELDRWVQSQYHRYGAGFDGVTTHLRAVLDVILAQQGQGAVLIHCAAGKDRTGFAIASILSALGVDRTRILDDYMITTENFLTRPVPREHLQPLFERNGLEDMPDRVLQKLCVAYRGAMEAALDYLDTTYGSMQEFLRQKVGLTSEEEDRLRSYLLEEQ